MATWSSEYQFGPSCRVSNLACCINRVDTSSIKVVGSEEAAYISYYSYGPIRKFKFQSTV